MTKRIIRIDASSLKTAACMLAFYRTVIDGYKYPVNNNDMEFGSAGHIFLKYMCETKGNVGIALPKSREYFETTKMVVKKQKQYMDSMHLMKVMLSYWEWLRVNDNFEILLRPDGKPAVEVTFSVKYYEDDNVIILLEGTIDKLGRFKNGCYAFGDYKFTSSRDIPIFFQGFELSTQLKFYYMCLHMYAEQNPNSFIAEICSNKVGAFIDGIFLNGKDSTEFHRSRIFFFEEPEITLYKNMMKEKIFRLLNHVVANEEPYPEGMVTDTCSKPENSSGGSWRCRFFKACAAPDKIAADFMLKNEFVKADYEPLKFGKEKEDGKEVS